MKAPHPAGGGAPSRRRTGVAAVQAAAVLEVEGDELPAPLPAVTPVDEDDDESDEDDEDVSLPLEPPASELEPAPVDSPGVSFGRCWTDPPDELERLSFL